MLAPGWRPVDPSYQPCRKSSIPPWPASSSGDSASQRCFDGIRFQLEPADALGASRIAHFAIKRAFLEVGGVADAFALDMLSRGSSSPKGLAVGDRCGLEKGHFLSHRDTLFSFDPSTAFIPPKPFSCMFCHQPCGRDDAKNDVRYAEQDESHRSHLPSAGMSSRAFL